jgi:hypothetical protein
MARSLTETAKAILMNETANAETLKPGSKQTDSMEKLEGSASTKIADAPVHATPNSGTNAGMAAAAPLKKDTSAPTKSAKAAEPTQHLEEDDEVDGDDIEISEELAEFIDKMVAEGASEDEIAAAIEENFELVEEKDEEKEDDEDEDEEEDDKEDMKESYQIDMSEHVNALLEGENLSEEFRAKATTIFEAAVNAKLQEELAALEEAFASTLEEEVKNIQEELASNVDDYLNYVVEQWVSENEVAIEAGLRTELTEEFISGLRQLFAENYIDIPEDKVSVVEELGSTVEELQAKLNEEIERNVELSKVLAESQKTEILNTVVEGLAATQAERLKSLAENVDFNNADEFTSKITTLRENYFPTTVKAQKELDSVDATADGKSMIQEELQGPMAKYVQALGKKLPN